MSNVDDLRGLFEEGKPLVRQWLALSEKFTKLREAATEKKLEWSQIKALLKASVQDEADNGGRVKKLLDRSGDVTAYADVLGLGRPEKKNNFSVPRGSSPLGKATAFQAVRDGFDSHGPLQSAPVSSTQTPPRQQDRVGAAGPTSGISGPAATNSDLGGESGNGEGRKATNATVPSAPLVAAAGDGGGPGEATATLDDPYNADIRTTMFDRTGEFVRA